MEQAARDEKDEKVWQDEQDAIAKAEKKPGLLVEDMSVVGGVDKETGAPVIKPKTSGGKADESMTATDPQEA